MAFKNKKDQNTPSMERQSSDEKLIATIHRHPFGILSVYVEVVLGLVAAGGLVYFVLPNFINRDDNPGAYVLVGVGMLVVGVLMLLILAIATIIYRESKLIITDKDVTEITQEGLFNRKISQLSISNIEDATAKRGGVFQTLLNYGTLNIETAGETENFIFPYCPEPDKYAKTILQLREQFLSNRERDRAEAGAQYMHMQETQAGYYYPPAYAAQYPPMPPPAAPGNPMGTPPQQQPYNPPVSAVAQGLQPAPPVHAAPSSPPPPTPQPYTPPQDEEFHLPELDETYPPTPPAPPQDTNYPPVTPSA